MEVGSDFYLSKIFIRPYLYTDSHIKAVTDVFRSHVQGCFQELQLNLKRFFLRDTRDKDIGYIMSLLRGQEVFLLFGFAT